MLYPVHPLKPNVYHIADPMHVFMTLIVGSEKALLFDTGYGTGRLDETVRQITALPLIVVNSHGHVDHVLGNPQFSEVHIHPADLTLYREHSGQRFKRQVAERYKTAPEFFAADFSPEAYLAAPAPKMLPLADGDTFDLGGVRLTVLHIPGHTQGGIALLDDRDRLLLVGDSASRHVWMFLQESTGLKQFVGSMEKLQAVGEHYDWIVAAHVPVLLPPDLLDQLIHCARHIDPAKSVPFTNPLASGGFVYCEGIDSLARSLGLDSIDLARTPLSDLDLDKADMAAIDFVSIVYKGAEAG